MKGVENPAMDLEDFLVSLKALKEGGWEVIHKADMIRLKPSGAEAGMCLCPICAVAMAHFGIDVLHSFSDTEGWKLLGMPSITANVIMDSADSRILGDKGIRARIIEALGLDREVEESPFIR